MIAYYFRLCRFMRFGRDSLSRDRKKRY